MVLRICADDREKLVIPYFSEYVCDEVEIEIGRIQIGDYAIYINNHILFIIERKSLNDLSASIRDGRKENIKKLIDLRKKTGCKILYLIEGKARHPPNKKIARIPYKNLQSHMDHIIMRDDVYIIYSDSPRDSAARLVEFALNWLSLGESEKYEACGDARVTGDARVASVASVARPDPNNASDGGSAEVLAMLNNPAPKTAARLIYEIWGCIPNVTDKTALLFIEAGYHISDLILGDIAEDDIYAMKYPSGVIIGKRAAKIVKVAGVNKSENFKTYCNMLARIDGVTKKTASLIITQLGIYELLSGSVELKTLASLQKTLNSKIGAKIAGKILEIFVKQNLT